MAREKEMFEIQVVPDLVLDEDEEMSNSFDVLRQLRPSHVLLVCHPENVRKIMEKVKFCLAPSI